MKLIFALIVLLFGVAITFIASILAIIITTFGVVAEQTEFDEYHHYPDNDL